MEKSLRDKITDLFNETEYDNSPNDISITKLLIWFAVITILSSLIPFIFHGGSPLIKTFTTIIILLFTTARPAFRWATKIKN